MQSSEDDADDADEEDTEAPSGPNRNKPPTKGRVKKEKKEKN